jgi:hypothetical protein
VGTLPPAAHDQLCSDLGLVQEAIKSGVVSKRAAAADAHWGRWVAFCKSLDLDPWLHEIQDPVPIIQVFGQRYRDGRIAPRKHAVKAGTVEDAIRAVGQTFARVGSTDIRKDANGEIDFRIRRQLRSYARTDPPPNRVKPIPVQVIFHVLAAAFSIRGSVGTQAIANMTVIAFFFLLRPGEYTGTTTDDHPFRLADVKLFVGRRQLDLWLAPTTELLSSTHISLVFTNQKNGVRGEVINHGRSGSPTACPVLATVRQVIHLRENGATPNTPLASFVQNGRTKHVTAANVTDSIRKSVAVLGPSVGLLPAEVNARSLRAGGAMALLCSEVDTNVIRLLGRWHSDSMMRYLHLQAQPIMQNFARRMLQGGDYELHRAEPVPLN